ncbi:MAG: CBS domain-containing protein [Candidatus Aenigmarchaeota archaeon]|nr:CBS domain-containing protein [Candidatus Aenigmarchaeota archaeon]
MKQVKDFMNTKVIILSPDDTIFDAAKLLAKLNIAGAPVVKDGKIVGIISISDIIKFIDIKLGKLPKIEFPGLSWLLLAFIQMQKLRVDVRRELEKASKSKVKDVMTKNVIVVSPSTTLVEVAEMMEKYDVNRLPVVDGGKLVGIVARADLIKALVD